MCFANVEVSVERWHVGMKNCSDNHQQINLIFDGIKSSPTTKRETSVKTELDLEVVLVSGDQKVTQPNCHGGEGVKLKVPKQSPHMNPIPPCSLVLCNIIQQSYGDKRLKLVSSVGQLRSSVTQKLDVELLLLHIKKSKFSVDGWIGLKVLFIFNSSQSTLVLPSTEFLLQKKK